MVKVRFNGRTGIGCKFFSEHITIIGNLVKERKNKIVVYGRMILPYKQVNDTYYSISKKDLILSDEYYG